MCFDSMISLLWCTMASNNRLKHFGPHTISNQVWGRPLFWMENMHIMESSYRSFIYPSTVKFAIWCLFSDKLQTNEFSWYSSPFFYVVVNGNTEIDMLCHKYYKKYCVCSLTSHSRACSTAGGPCSNRSRSAHLNTPRTWRRSRARSARSRAAGSGRRWEPRSLRTAPRLLGTPDLRGTGPVVGTDRQQVGSGLGGPQVDRAGRRISCLKNTGASTFFQASEKSSRISFLFILM